MRRNQSMSHGLGTVAMFETRWADEAQRAIRAAFLGMAKHLRSRPATCRSPFDEAGGARQTPGWALVKAGRACLDAACEKGEPTMAATRREITAFYDELKAATLHGYELGDVCPTRAIVEFAVEQGEAQAATTRYATTRDPQDAEAMRKEVREALDAGARVLDLGWRFQLPTHPLSMGAVR